VVVCWSCPGVLAGTWLPVFRPLCGQGPNFASVKQDFRLLFVFCIICCALIKSAVRSSERGRNSVQAGNVGRTMMLMHTWKYGECQRKAKQHGREHRKITCRTTRSPHEATARRTSKPSQKLSTPSKHKSSRNKYAFGTATHVHHLDYRRWNLTNSAEGDAVCPKAPVAAYKPDRHSDTWPRQ
jgi:hypothetical protein